MNVVLAVFLPLAIGYATALWWCVERWNAPTQYFAHGWLVPIVATAVVWSRRRAWRTAPASPDARGWWLLGPALALHAFGLLLMVDSWSAASLVLAVPGACLLVFGGARLRGLWPVVGLVLFFVPLPIFVEGRMAFVLKEIAVNGGAALANLLGADVVRTSDSLRPNGASAGLYVADACSGLRSLLSMAMLAWCIAFFTGPASAVRRAVLLLVAAPVAIAANVVRIALLCLLARWFGVSFAEGTGHSLANVAEWVADLAVLLAIDSRFRRGVAPAAVAPALPTIPRAGNVRRVASVAWVLAGPLLWLGLHRPFTDGHGRAEGLPAVVGAWAVVPRSAAAEARFQRNLPQWWELLGTRDFVWRHYRTADRHAVQLVGLFHDTNWKSVHPPRICIEGSNMDIERDDLVAAPWLGPSATASRIVARSRTKGQRFVTLSVFGTGGWTSGSYAEFFWHHLPRALLRRSESGFLLRVESPIEAGEADAVAEERCAGFLGLIVPAAMEMVR